jgi:hypothetical protein
VFNRFRVQWANAFAFSEYAASPEDGGTERRDRRQAAKQEQNGLGSVAGIGGLLEERQPTRTRAGHRRSVGTRRHPAAEAAHQDPAAWVAAV